MIILFGFRRRLTQVAIVLLTCRNGHRAAQRVVKVVRWFTLFFIPVIPVSTRYRMVCTMCGLQSPLTKAQALEFKESPSVPSGPVPSTAAVVLDPLSPGVPAAVQPAGGPDPAPSPGWFPDPSGQSGLRWWDGSKWTEESRPTV